MATFKVGPTISKIAGSLGEHVYSSCRGQGYIRSKSSNRANVSSSRQSTARSGLTALSKEWSETLTDSERSRWNSFVQESKVTLDPASSLEQGSRVVITQPKSVLSGYNAFIRANQRAIETGIRTLDNPITLPVRNFPNPVTDLETLTYPPVIRNFALDFDGVNEDVLLGNILNYEYTDPQAWEFWVNPDTFIISTYLMSKMDITFFAGYNVWFVPTGLVWGIQGLIPGESLSIQRTFTTTGSWAQIVVTYNGSNTIAGFEIYVNNVPGHIIRVNIPITISMLTSDPLLFASHASVVGTQFNGKLDCIRNFNRNLIQADVNILWNTGAGRYGADPLGDGSCQGSWPFCVGAGNTLPDISGNNYHGTLQNMEPGDWIIGHVPCPTIPGFDGITWAEPPGLPAGCKVRIWILSYDAGVHKQHVATVDIGLGAFEFTTVRVAQGKSVPIASMPGHYLVQADIISPGGNQSPPSNTIEMTIP